jgi:hypothetical protein
LRLGFTAPTAPSLPQEFSRPAVLKFDSPENPAKAPTIDLKAWQRNKPTAWLEFVDRLSSCLWQDNEGAARWTLVLDDAERHVSTTHPPRNAASLKLQVLHQSRLKHALVTAFGCIYKTIINAHPNTEALDASGNVIPFGTNLLRAIGAKIVPEDAEGVTHANLELQRQIYTFPWLARGIEPLRGWCDRILLLFNDLGRLSNSDQNSAVCPQLELLLTTYNTPNDPVSWTRCLELLRSEPAYIAAGPTVSLYVQHIDRFATKHVASKKLTGVRQGGHFKAAYSAEALCWVCGSANHDLRQCKMLNSALTDYKSKHLHGKGTPCGGPGSSGIARGGSFRGAARAAAARTTQELLAVEALRAATDVVDTRATSKTGPTIRTTSLAASSPALPKVEHTLPTLLCRHRRPTLPRRSSILPLRQVTTRRSQSLL